MPIITTQDQKGLSGVKTGDMGCHEPGKKRRSGKPLYKQPPTEGSKTQKRKIGKRTHTPARK